jgi:hypothetical protein
VRRLIVFAIVVAGLSFAASAFATITYGGPKTWLPGYAANTGYDNSGNRWWLNWFTNKSTPYRKALVVFIRSDGSWAVSAENDNATTAINLYSGFNYQKKAYCKNTSVYTYTGECIADAQAP